LGWMTRYLDSRMLVSSERKVRASRCRIVGSQRSILGTILACAPWIPTICPVTASAFVLAFTIGQTCCLSPRFSNMANSATTLPFEVTALRASLRVVWCATSPRTSLLEIFGSFVLESGRSASNLATAPIALTWKDGMVDGWRSDSVFSRSARIDVMFVPFCSLRQRAKAARCGDAGRNMVRPYNLRPLHFLRIAQRYLEPGNFGRGGRPL
jgi:hypothetical protein